MTFNEYQQKTSTTAVFRDKIAAITTNKGMQHLLNLNYLGFGLGEVGEVQGKLKKIIRDYGGIVTDEMKVKIEKELGDVLWYVSEMCTELGIRLEEVAVRNLEKLESRKERGVLEGSGDDR